MVHMFASGHGSLAKVSHSNPRLSSHDSNRHPVALTQHHALQRFLEHAVFDILSNLTYGLYLWALLIMEVYQRSKQ